MGLASIQGFDLSPELLITPYLNGVKLKKPNSREKSFIENEKLISVASSLSMPFNVYFLNKINHIAHINEIGAETIGASSSNDAIGKSILDTKIISKDSLMELMMINNEVISTQQRTITEDTVFFNDDKTVNFLTIKVPAYDYNDKLIGLFGCSVLLGQHCLVNSLTQITKFGLLTDNTNPKIFLPGKYINNSYISQRENQIINLLIRGLSARQIGERVFLGQRTIEKHIENIKFKLSVNTKAELIEKIFIMAEENI